MIALRSRHLKRGRYSLIGLFALGAHAALVRDARAFAGQYHAEVTNQATAQFGFEPLSAAAILVGNLDSDAPPANTVIDEGEWYSSAAHFDDEDFSAGAARLRAKLDLAVSSIAKGRKDLAIEAIGRALHGLQDFMSHSNFVINTPDAPIDLLAITDPSPADRSKPVDCKTGKGPLTSGYWYYTESDISQHLAKRISAPANRCMHSDLAKDTPGYPAGPVMHAVAKKRALELSLNFLERVKAKLEKDYPGKNLFGLLLKDGDMCQSVFAQYPNLANPARLVPRPAVNWGNGKAYFFKGSQYVRYDIAKGVPDPGYPKPISAEWPGIWPTGFDAVVKVSDRRAFFFKGNQYVRYTIDRDLLTGQDKSHPDAGYPMTINDSTWPGLWGVKGVDAGVDWGPLGLLGSDHRLFFFKGAEYVRYNTKNGGVPESGHLALTSQSWKGICANGLDGVINWGNGKAYLFKGNQYFRYDIKNDTADPGYPKPVNEVYWPGL